MGWTLLSRDCPIDDHQIHSRGEEIEEQAALTAPTAIGIRLHIDSDVAKTSSQQNWLIWGKKRRWSDKNCRGVRRAFRKPHILDIATMSLAYASRYQDRRPSGTVNTKAGHKFGGADALIRDDFLLLSADRI